MAPVYERPWPERSAWNANAEGFRAFGTPVQRVGIAGSARARPFITLVPRIPPLHDAVVRLLRPCEGAARASRASPTTRSRSTTIRPSGRRVFDLGSRWTVPLVHDRRRADRRLPGARRARPLRAPGRASRRVTAPPAFAVDRTAPTARRSAFGRAAGSAGRTSCRARRRRSARAASGSGRTARRRARRRGTRAASSRTRRPAARSRGASSPVARSRAGAPCGSRGGAARARRGRDCRRHAADAACCATAPRRHRCSRARRSSAGRAAPT